jgi:hypothetical protein
MSFFHNVVCPVSNIKINSYASRITVFINAVLLALYLLTGIPYLVAIVAIDYGIRALWNPEYSPLRWLALRILSATNLSEKLTDQAPKLFASRIGFLFALTSTIFFPLSATVSLVIAGILFVFATLDSVFDFCVGCLTYTYIVLPFYQFMGIRERTSTSHKA